jgi:hypothetical protein
VKDKTRDFIFVVDSRKEAEEWMGTIEYLKTKASVDLFINKFGGNVKIQMGDDFQPVLSQYQGKFYILYVFSAWQTIEQVWGVPPATGVQPESRAEPLPDKALRESASDFYFKEAKKEASVKTIPDWNTRWG